jgi:hypothetical protein
MLSSQNIREVPNGRKGNRVNADLFFFQILKRTINFLFYWKYNKNGNAAPSE